jgi:hypothetical protein
VIRDRVEKDGRSDPRSARGGRRSGPSPERTRVVAPRAPASPPGVAGVRPRLRGPGALELGGWRRPMRPRSTPAGANCACRAPAA